METQNTPISKQKVNLPEYISLNHSLLGMCFAKGAARLHQRWRSLRSRAVCPVPALALLGGWGELAIFARARPARRRIAACRIRRHARERPPRSLRVCDHCVTRRKHMGVREVSGWRMGSGSVGGRYHGYDRHACHLHLQVRTGDVQRHEVPNRGARMRTHFARSSSRAAPRRGRPSDTRGARGRR